MAYGIEIKNGSNVLIIDETNRISNVICSGSVLLDVGDDGSAPWSETSGNIPCTGMTSENASEFDVWVGNGPIGGHTAYTNQIIINRYTNYFTITYQSYTANDSINFKYMGLRY
jgi:hypothetical protein